MNSKIEYAIIVKNKTRVETLVERFNTKAQASFYVEKSGGKFEDYEEEHEHFYDAISVLQKEITRNIKNKIIDRSFLPNYIFSENQLIIVIGQDGLVANTAKYAHGIPIIGVNPDPDRYDGVLLPFQAHNALHAVERVMSGKYEQKQVTMAEARLNDGQRLLAFNDFYIGAASHISSRYTISYNNESEEHSSSGIIISTGAGSTGWLSSVYNMASGIMDKQKFSNTKSMVKTVINPPQEQKNPFQLPWDTEKLMFVVREPFASKKSQTNITNGFIHANSPLQLESRMPNYGVIFSDGIETDHLRFNSGTVAQIGIAKEKAHLVI